MRGCIIGVLALAACGGTEPLPMAEPVDEVSVLVRNDALASIPCGRLRMFEIKAKLEISGVVGACQVYLKDDATALSLCDAVPGKKPRSLLLTYYHPQKRTTLDLATIETTIDLTNETNDTVEVDFSLGELVYEDFDEDGVSNFEELCSDRDPRVSG